MATKPASAYKKLSHREHILELPDTYIGSIDIVKEHRWIYNTEKDEMDWTEVTLSPGFLKIFDEILVNALDHRVRQQGSTAADALPVKNISVTLTSDRITVRNDGDGIPVAKHESGVWIPEMIFGHLLTSSNYDKTEEKIVGGKNGYGSKCLENNTKVLLFDSSVKLAKDIKIGDKLIGDDGMDRTVLNVIKGSGQMYKINQANADSYIVNDEHILTLMMPDHKVIFWNDTFNSWNVLWWNKDTNVIQKKTIIAKRKDKITCEECGEELASNLIRHYSRKHPEKSVPKKERKSPTNLPIETEEIKKARIEMEEFCKTISDNNVFDISIKDYMKMNATAKIRLAGVRGQSVQWNNRAVFIDPYVLGLWLGDGMQTGYAFACYGEKDSELISYLTEWGKSNDATIKQTANKYAYRLSSISNFGKMHSSPLKKQLAKYGLIKNKHIPQEYLVNDRDTRLKLLAGIIDTDGHVSRNGTRVIISQGECHTLLAEQIAYLSRSLGFCTSIHLRDVSYTHKGEKLTSKAYIINISGEHLSDIPTLLPRKKCANSMIHKTSSSTGFITIEDAGIKEYVGIEIDKNQRFLINDFTVTHNCTSIFSKEFMITTVDHRSKKKYVQTWRNNMSVCEPPTMTASTVKPFTEINFVPDLIRFGMTGKAIPSDVLQVLATRVVDAAMSAGKDCKVSLNGTVIGANAFPKYMKLYLKDTDGASSGSDGKRIAYEQAGERWEIGAMLTRDLHGEAPPDQRHISFVNGIYTRKGGKHVDYVLQKVLAAFCEYAKKKKLEITPGLLKESIVLFLNATIVNPSFDTQTKETLTTPSSKFGSLPVLSDKFIDTLGKIGLLEEARILLEAKTKKDAKRMDGKKRVSIRGIPKLEDAIWAGGARSAECTLILTEGDSAATTAISGLKVIGREQYGVFPLKGKILNVKDIPAAKRLANVELANINKILGLESRKVYKSLSELRYGRIMIMTDQDVDGSHIKGLLMNLFQTDWPSLLKLGFLCCMMTPLLKAIKGSTTLCFYSESEYEAWKASNDTRGWKTKYYKGLGTSTAEEAREYFRTMHTVSYKWEEKVTDEAIDLAFNKKRADDRKEWLSTYSRDRHLEVAPGGSVGYREFVDKELIHFSVADCERSLPHIMDGLKTSQRKILWSALKRNLVSEIRVAQLAGYVSETAAYHHGEESLHGAIIGMAQTFVGSNNINLLVPAGQMGSRLLGGKDAASPRYIHTYLEPILKTLIKKEDDPILKRMDDDGLLVEPETYLPILPLILVNGAAGIGTGYSTDVPPYNPIDIVKALRAKLTGSPLPVLKPWWFGFKGLIHKPAANTYVTKGLYEFVDEEAHTIRIKELPVGRWTKNYKEFLEKMLAEQEEEKLAAKKDEKKTGTTSMAHLKSFEEAYNDIDVDFILHMEPDGYHEAKRYPEEFEKRFKMTTSFSTSNMVAFDVDGKIKKYETVQDILDTFYTARLDGYVRRKAHQLEEMAKHLIELNAKYVFVLAIVEKRLIVTNVSDEDLLAGLKGLKLPPLSDGDALKGYEYLLRMRIDRLKASSVAELAKEVADMTAERDRLAATPPETIWSLELDAFSAAWDTYSKERTATYTVAATVPIKKKRTVKPKATLSIE